MIDPAILLAFAERLESTDRVLETMEVLDEAKRAGLDLHALKQAVAERAMAADERARCQQHLDAYRLALGLATWSGFVERAIHDRELIAC